MTTTTI